MITGNYAAAGLDGLALIGLDFIKDGKKITNAVPDRMSRVIPAELGDTKMLGKTTDSDVFVTAADDLKDAKNSTDVAKTLTLKNSDGSFVEGPFKVIDFDTPKSGVASPVNRTNDEFVGKGRTDGGAREFSIPNKEIKELEKASTQIIE